MNSTRNATLLSLQLALLMGVTSAAKATEWTRTIDSGTYSSTGTIKFDDWGYVGPSGVGANDYQVGSGFDHTQIGQIQRVQTVAPDWKSPDGSATVVMPEFGVTSTYTDASLDGQVNFYNWVYTTPSSTFNNMQIDKAGNYYVAKEDMSFGYYDSFSYHDVTGANADQGVSTKMQFQPYAISDAKGWCGSVLASNPAALEVMAGQVTFDFAFDHYFSWGGAANPQLVPDFVMRSYGSYTVDVTTAGGELQHFESSAVVNNTSPETGEVDPDFYNRVSFHGAGVVPLGAWVSADSFNADGTRKLNADGTWDVTIVEEDTEGAVWYRNSFAGYAFILRADGMRIIEGLDLSEYDDLSNVPEGALAGVANLAPVPAPAAFWLFGAGGLSLIGLVRRRTVAPKQPS